MSAPGRCGSGVVKPVLLHGTTIALGSRAAIIVGPSGSGKSDLALRCLAVPAREPFGDGAHLVSDDQTIIELIGDRLVATAPPAIQGRLEVRGLGIITVPVTARAELMLVAELVDEVPERMPPRPPRTLRVHDWPVPVITLQPFEASAPLKLLVALQQMEDPI